MISVSSNSNLQCITSYYVLFYQHNYYFGLSRMIRNIRQILNFTNFIFQNNINHRLYLLYYK